MYTKFKPFAVPFATIAGLLLIIMWVAGAFDTKIEPNEISSASKYNAHTLALKISTIPSYEYVSATIHSKQSIQVAARILAPIKSIKVKAGDLVKKGDLLIELDNRNNQANVAQSKENIRAIYANLVQAKSHHLRIKHLFSKESATKAQLEQANANYQSLKAQLASAKQRLQSAQTTSSYSQIKAQFSARVIDRYAEPGDLAAPGMKLLTLYDPNSLRIEANIRESLAITLKIGQQLDTQVPTLNKTIQANIDEIVPAANPGSRSFLIKATIEHDEHMLPGMFAKISIPSGKSEQLLIPENYIKKMGQLDVTWVLENNTAIRRFIRIGQKRGNMVQVLSGLNANDKLILPKHLDTK